MMQTETVPPADIHWFAEYFSETWELMRDQLETSDSEVSPEVSIETLYDAMEQLIDVLLTYEEQLNYPEDDTSSSIQPDLADLNDYGLSILESLCQYSLEMELDMDSHQWEKLSISLALWGVHHGADLCSFTLITNGLAHIANNVTTLKHLEYLYTTMSEVLDAAAMETIDEALFNDPNHPWRVLLFNRAIVATRTLSAQLIKEAFSSIEEHLPEEAPNFFSEGLAHLEEEEFPDETKRLVAEFYQNCQKPLLH